MEFKLDKSDLLLYIIKLKMPVASYVLLLALCCTFSFNRGDVPLRSQDVTVLMEEGKRLYNLMQAKTTLPSLGPCWKNAVASLHHGCKHFNDQVQSEIALRFTNCFLETSGHGTYVCASINPNERQSCLSSMPDRAFIAYTEFYTHAQRLSTNAAHVAQQLETSEVLQEELLSHQKQSVELQQELLNNGMTLGQVILESRDSISLMFHEFRSSTLEQQRLLSMVFHHLSALQSWVVGEVSWVDSIAFYIPSFALGFFLTAAHRTSSARIPIFLILVVSGLLERLVAKVMLQTDSEHLLPVDVLNDQLNWWIWLIRRSTVVLCLGVLVMILYYYSDQEKAKHQLLLQIRNQNEELLHYIRQERSPNKRELHHIVQGLQDFNSDEPDSFGYTVVPTISSASPNHHTYKTHSTVNGYNIHHVEPVNEDSDLSGIAPLQPSLRDDTKENILEETSPFSRISTSVERNSRLSSTPKQTKKPLKSSEKSLTNSPISSRYSLRSKTTV